VTISSLVVNLAFPRAVVVGVFGGAGLALTAVYSRRGPMIYPVYAATMAALALLLARYQALEFAPRLAAALVGFCIASAVLYVTVGVLADRQRQRLVAAGRLPAATLGEHLSLLGHAWRITALVGVGAVVSAGVAFLSA